METSTTQPGGKKYSVPLSHTLDISMSRNFCTSTLGSPEDYYETDYELIGY